MAAAAATVADVLSNHQEILSEKNCAPSFQTTHNIPSPLSFRHFGSSLQKNLNFFQDREKKFSLSRILLYKSNSDFSDSAILGDIVTA
ncbi:MAG: hypothetical protein CSB33_04735 [Desulfobacterales bacterium]|nr:MAG: hypothetical protein CSB33_04735 [Desulfobacterales bacterium]